jgi:acetyl-CoA carboxylase alpha subunit
MSIAEAIIKDVQALSESKQVEVPDFVQYLRSKAEKQERKDWADFSLSSAMRGMEDEEAPYSINDIKESFT